MARLRNILIIAVLAVSMAACGGSFHEAPETEVTPTSNIYIREIDAHITEVTVNGRQCILIDDNGISCDWSQDAPQ